MPRPPARAVVRAPPVILDAEFGRMASAAISAADELINSAGGSSTRIAEDATSAALAGFNALGLGGGADGVAGATAAPAVAVTAPTATKATAGAAGGGAGECLITKWAAVWVVHQADKTRSNVGFPTPGCESLARLLSMKK